MSHSARSVIMFLPFQHSRHGVGLLFHDLIFTFLWMMPNDAFLSLGVRAGRCETFHIRSQRRLPPPILASLTACARRGAEAYSMKALVSSLTVSRLIGVAVIASLKVTPAGLGYKFSAMPRAPFQ